MIHCRRNRTLGIALLCLVLAAAVHAQDRQITISRELLGTRDILTPVEIQVKDISRPELELAPNPRIVEGELVLTLPEEPGEYFVKPPETANLPLPRERLQLPGFVVRVPPPIPHPEDMASEREQKADTVYVPTIIADPVPASWTRANEKYSITLRLGLEAEPPEARSASLTSPVVVKFSFFNMRDVTADPGDTVTLSKTGVANEQQVHLQFIPTSAQPALKLRSDVTDVDFSIAVLPRIELTPIRSSMLGWGFETLKVTVAHLTPNGEELPVDDDMRVFLQIDGAARLEPDTAVVIPAGKADGSFTLRSTGMGPVTVAARAGGHVDEHRIPLTIPYVPLILVPLAGAAGGYLRRFLKGAPDVPAGTLMIEGALVAMVLYAAAVVGVVSAGVPVDFLPIPVGAFVVGALAGFTGVSLIQWLSRKVLPLLRLSG